MPTYTYRCNKCAHEFEIVQGMTDPPRKRCPECRGAVQRTFHPVGIVLKGSGFHRNDYKSSTGTKTESKKKEETTTKSDSSDSSASGTSDSGSSGSSSDS